MDEPDPDLILAIALSQSMMEEETQQGQTEASVLQPTATSSDVLMRDDTTSSTGGQISENPTTIYLDELIETLKKEEPFTTWAEFQSSLQPLPALLDESLAGENFPSSGGQLRFLVQFLELVGGTVLNTSFKQLGAASQASELVEGICNSILRFGMNTIEYLSGTGSNMEDSLELLSEAFRLVESLCCSEKVGNKTTLSRLKKDVKRKSLEFTSGSFNSKSTSSEITNLLNRLLSINPLLLEESTSSADHAEEGSQGKELSQTEILTHNTEYLDSELQGISRLLAVSIKLLPLQDKLETSDDLAVYEKALRFMGRIIEFFLSESFDDELGDSHATPWAVYLIYRLTQIYHLERAYNRKTKETTVLIDRPLFEDLFHLINIKLGDEVVHHNIQTFVVASVFASLDELELESFDAILTAGMSFTGVRQVLDLDAPTLVPMSVDILKYLFTEPITVGLAKVTTESQPSLAGPPPPTSYTFKGTEFDCLASNYTQKTLTQFIISSSSRPLLDILFSLLLISFVIQSQTNALQQTTPKGLPADTIASPRTSKKESVEEPEAGDELWFGDLFSEGKTKSETEPPKPEKCVIENEVLETAKDILHLLEISISSDGRRFPVVKEHIRSRFSKIHIDAIIFLASNLSPSVPVVGLSGRTVGPTVVDSEFLGAFRLLVRGLVVNGFFVEHEAYFLQRAGLEKDRWPLSPPLEIILISARVLLKLQQSKEGAEKMIVGIWKGFLLSLHNAITAKDLASEKKEVGFENLQLISFIYHTLPTKVRIQLLHYTFNTLTSIDFSQSFSWESQLAVTRLLLLAEYALVYFSSFPPEVASIEANLFSRSPQGQVRILESSVVTTELRDSLVKESRDNSTTLDPLVFYELANVSDARGRATGASEFSSSPDYDSLYEKLLYLLSLRSIEHPSTVYHQILENYYFSIAWRLLGLLSPSRPFIESARSGTAEALQHPGNATLHYLRSLIREHEASTTKTIPSSLFSLSSSLLRKLVDQLSSDSSLRIGSLVESVVAILHRSLSENKEGTSALDPSLNVKELLDTSLLITQQYTKLLLSQITNQISKGLSTEDTTLLWLLLAANISSGSLMAVSTRLGFPYDTAIRLLDGTQSKPSTDVGASLGSRFDESFLAHPTSNGVSKATSANITSSQRILWTLIELCGALVTKLKLSTVDPSVFSGDFLNTLSTLVTNRCTSFLAPRCNTLFEEAIGTELLNCLVDVHKFSHIEELLVFVSAGEITGTANQRTEATEPALVECLGFLNDSCSKDSPRSQHLMLYYSGKGYDDSKPLEHSLPKGKLSVIFSLLLNNQSPKINEDGLQFLCNCIELFENEPSGFSVLASELLQMSKETLASWFTQKLLGVSLPNGAKVAASDKTRKSVVKIVRSLTGGKEESTQLGLYIFDVLLLFLKPAFLDWSSQVKDYFSLVQLLSAELNQFHRLTSAITSLLASEEFERFTPSPDQLNSLALVLDFVEIVLRLTCRGHKGKEEDRGEKMTIEGEGSEDGTDDTDEEQELAARLCTYTTTENNFMEQHWYYCYTCGLTFSEGVCSVCAKVCHKGHEVSYSRKSRFFCDCGAGAVRGLTCSALKPRPYQPISLPSEKETTEESSAMDVDTSEVTSEPATNSLLNEQVRVSIIQQVRQDNLAKTLFAIFEKVLEFMKQESKVKPSTRVNLDLMSAKSLQTKTDIYTLKRTLKAGSLESKLKYDSSSGRDLKTLLANNSITRRGLCSNSIGLIAVAEGDKATIIDAAKLLDDKKGAGAVIDKNSFKVLSKNPLPFEILYMSFNSANENFLAVAGLKECSILTLNSRSEAADQLNIDLSLDALGESIYILQVHWIPGSQVKLAVVTNRFVKIYDLSKDNICPVHFFTLLDDSVKDATFALNDRGDITMYLISSSGLLFAQPILDAAGDAGGFLLTETVPIPDTHRGKSGAALHFSPTMNMLICTFEDGRSFAGRLNESSTAFESTFAISLADSAAGLSRSNRPSPYNHWVELVDFPGHLACISKKANQVVGVQIQKSAVFTQNVRINSTRCEGLTVINQSPSLISSSKYESCLLVLQEEGSLQRYDIVSKENSSSDQSTPAEEKGLYAASSSSSSSSLCSDDLPEVEPKGDESLLSFIAARLGASGSMVTEPRKRAKKTVSKGTAPEKPITSTRKPQFPVDFFEKVECITPQIALAGDVLVCYTSDVAKTKLASNDEYIVSPNNDSFTIVVQNNNQDLVMVGARVLVGSASLQHVPTSLKVFDRTIEITEGMRRWYDIPFTVEESLTAEKEFTLVASATYNSGNPPLIDSIEVYALSKEEFGWRKRLESLDNNQLELSSSKPQNPLEKVLVGILNVLNLYYSAPGVSSEKNSSYTSLLQLVPTLLNDSTLSVLREAVKKLLLSLQPNREAYYALKDSTQLRYIAQRLNATQDSFATVEDAKNFTRFAKITRKVAIARHANFARLLDEAPTFPADLLKHFWLIYSRNCSQFDDVDSVVEGLVEVIVGFSKSLQDKSMDEGSNAIRPVLSLLQSILSCPYDAVRSKASSALSLLLRPKTPPRLLLPKSEGKDAMEIDTNGDDSVFQYSCNKCHISPIVGKRWHCEECEDYDLCDDCHSSGAFPSSWHQLTHPVTCVTPDDAVLLAALVPPGVDLDDEEQLLKLAIELSMEVSQPLATEDAVASTTDQGLRESFFSLLLEETANMKNRGGLAAIPFLQVIYSLAQQNLTSDIVEEKERLRNLAEAVFCGKKMDFKISPKTPQLEVEIVLLMLFANLLEPPTEKKPEKSSSKVYAPAPKPKGKKGDSEDRFKITVSPQVLKFISKELARELRRLNVTDYLFSLAKGLYEAFKKQPKSKEKSGLEAPSGALLKPHADVSAQDLEPFFSESYVKDHQNGLFEDYQKILLSTVIQLVQALCSSGDSGEKGLLDENWQELICQLINMKQTSFIRESAKKLLHLMCKSKKKSYEVRDSCFLTNLHKKVTKLGDYSNNFSEELPYDKNVKLISCLSSMWEIASSRPYNWQLHCIQNEAILHLLYRASFFLSEETVLFALKLLGHAFIPTEELCKVDNSEPILSKSKDEAKKLERDERREKKRKEKAELLEAAQQISQEMKKKVEIFLREEELSLVVTVFLLESNTSSVRTEARNFIHCLWRLSTPEQQAFIFDLLWQRLAYIPPYGRNAAEFIDLVGFTISQPDISQRIASSPSLLSTLLRALQSQNTLLSNHPNSYIYKTLSNLVEFDGYYLESEPCLVCNDPEVPYSNFKLDLLKSDTFKFTDSCQIIKFFCSHTVSSITIHLNEVKKAKMVRVINLFYNNKAVPDVAELRNKWALWKRAKSCHFSPHQTELKVDFPIPITATNFMIEYAAFYENHQAMAAEKLQCPRCNRVVVDKHGICKHCRENAYQCRQCRNINYENLNAFLCNECGYCKYGSFSYVFLAKPSYATERMESEEDRKKGLATIDTELANAHKRYMQMSVFKKPLSKLITGINGVSDDGKETNEPPSAYNKINRKITGLAALYGKECKTAFDSLSKSVQVLLGTRRELIRYNNSKKKGVSIPTRPLSTADIRNRPPNRCFGCANSFLGHCLALLEQLAEKDAIRAILVEQGVLDELFTHNLHQGSVRPDVRRVIGLLTKDDLAATSRLNNLILNKVNWCLEHYHSIDLASSVQSEIQLLTELAIGDDIGWESRLRIVMDLFFRAIDLGETSPIIAEVLTLPCLRTLSHLARLPSQPVPKIEVDKTPAPPESVVSKLRASVAVPLRAVSKTTLDRITPKQKGADETSGSQVVSKIPFVPLGDAPTVSPAEWQTMLFAEWSKKHQGFILTGDNKSNFEDKLNFFLASKYFRKWRLIAQKKTPVAMPTLDSDTWIKKLLLSRTSQSIRSEAAALIESLSQSSESRFFHFLDMIVTILENVGGAGESATELFELFKKMTQPKNRLLYLTAKGFLQSICRLITKEIDRIRHLETTYAVDISQGFVLKTFVDFLASFLEVPSIRSKFKAERLMDVLLNGFLWLRGLVIQKTKLTDDSAQLLMNLFNSLQSDTQEDKQQFMVACISALDKHMGDGKTPVFIFEQLCNIICPTKPEPVYHLILNKAATQEDFIRGTMNKNPYSSAEVGPLMRDVKNKICTGLDLRGLLEDDNGMELLVHNKIIKLDLTIRQVYEQVWKKGVMEAAMNSSSGNANATALAENSPMVVVFRLQGLDGEATEEIVERLEDQDKEERDPEEVYGIASVMTDSGGLDAMLRVLKQISDFDAEQEISTLLLKLLFYCCKIRINRRKMVELGAIPIMLEKFKLAFPRESQANIAEQLLLTTESVLEEANKMGAEHAHGDAMETEQGLDAAMSQMTMFLEKLSSPLVRCNTRISKTMTRLIPYLTYGHERIMELLIDYFLPYLAFENYDTKTHEDPLVTLYLDCLVNVVQNIKSDENGLLLKSLLMKKGVTKLLVDYVQSHASPKDINSEEWKQAMALPSLGFVFKMLTGLCKAHQVTQHYLVETNIIPAIHLLEDPSAANGSLAQDLLDALDVDPKAQEAVKNVREATRLAKKEQAQKYRMNVLAQVGVEEDLTGKLKAKMNSLGMDIDIPDEKGFTCKVCREGYSYKADEILGVYTFSKKVGLQSTPSRADLGISTVTHFNLVHFSCHQKCSKADRALKTPKEEWEGATLRNSSTKCNNLFPIQGPGITDDNYSANLNKFWANVNNIVRSDSSRFRILAHDLKFLLLRYAKEENFAIDSKGGGRDSNAKFIPFMIQMGLFLLDQKDGAQRRTYEKSLSTFLAQGSELWVATALQADNVVYQLILSLFLHSPEEWKEIKFVLFKRLLTYAFVEHAHQVSTFSSSSSSSSASPSASDSEFKVVRPYLIYFTMIEKLQELKKRSGVPATLQTATTVTHKSDETWIDQLKKSIKESGDTQMMETMMELLQTYEDPLLVFENLMEFVEEISLLAAVLAESSNVDEWLKKIRDSSTPSPPSSSSSSSSSSSARS